MVGLFLLLSAGSLIDWKLYFGPFLCIKTNLVRTEAVTAAPSMPFSSISNSTAWLTLETKAREFSPSNGEKSAEPSSKICSIPIFLIEVYTKVSYLSFLTSSPDLMSSLNESFTFGIINFSFFLLSCFRIVGYFSITYCEISSFGLSGTQIWIVILEISFKGSKKIVKIHHLGRSAFISFLGWQWKLINIDPIIGILECSCENGFFLVNPVDIRSPFKTILLVAVPKWLLETLLFLKKRWLKLIPMFLRFSSVKRTNGFFHWALR